MAIFIQPTQKGTLTVLHALVTIVSAMGSPAAKAVSSFGLGGHQQRLNPTERLSGYTQSLGQISEQYQAHDIGWAALSLREDKNPSQIGAIKQQVGSWLHKNYPQPYLQLQIDLHQRSHHQGPHSVSLSYQFGGIPLCGPRARLLVYPSGTMSLMGTWPTETILPPTDLDGPDRQGLIPIISEQRSFPDLATDQARILSTYRCFVIEDQQLRAAREVQLLIEDLPYRAIVTSTAVVSFEASYYAAVAAARAYRRNPEDGALSYFSIGNMDGSGLLRSTTFRVKAESEEPAKDCRNIFDYEPSSSHFAQASALSYATETLSWFHSKLGYKWTSDPITLITHALIGNPPNEKNNALYLPAAMTEDGKPNILLGDGDGIQLQYLALDNDVMSHEFGHHVIYDTLKSTSGESLVIHEGLADFFTFARTGDPCLGESICPEGSQFCWVQSCLRTAENDLKWGGANLPSGGHERSQFISGMLWDLHKVYQAPLEDIAVVVYQATRHFSDKAGYQNLMDALFLADSEFFNGKYCQDIYQAAEQRGMRNYISQQTCNGSNLYADENGAWALTQIETGDTQYLLGISDDDQALASATLRCPRIDNASDYIFSPCGVVSSLSGPPTLGGRLLFLLLWMLPPLFAWRRASAASR